MDLYLASAIVETINKLETKQIRRITVLTRAGAPNCTIERGNIVRELAQKLNLPIPEAQIKQIKDEGSYPPGFPIVA